MRSSAILILLLSLTLPLTAQDVTLTTYDWATAGINLSYPDNWDEPLPAETDGQFNLQMAQVLVDAPADVRPPAIPIINLTRFPNGQPADGNLLPFMFVALQMLGVDTFADPTTATFLESQAPELTGTSADSQFFGVARVALIGENDVLVIAGRSINATQNEFLAIFDAVASSARTSTGAASGGDYGVLWHAQRTLDDGDEALVDLIGLAYGPSDTLYTFERILGLVQIDALTGGILSITPNENITNPTALAVTSDGTAFVADTNCGCIFTLTPDGTWLDQLTEDPESDEGLITGFGVDAPQHIAVGAGNTLYATNLDEDNTISILSFQNGEQTNVIALDPDLSQQPLLSADSAGQVIALTPFGDLLAVGPDAVTELNGLNQLPEQMNALALTPTNDLVIATADQGVLIYTQDGEFVSQPGIVVPVSPLPGEMVAPAGVALDSQGTLFFVDSDGSFSAWTALSTAVASDRLGSTSLVEGQAVQGSLSSDTPQQTWTYVGTAGERVTITALDNSGIALDLALRLIAPDGSEEALNDDHESLDLLSPTDSQITDHPLAASGTYQVIVDQVEGEGSYTLGLSLTRAIMLDPSGITILTGQLDAVFPTDILEFNATAGQILTITLEANGGDLDPLLRLVGPDGSEVGFNDDADDTALGADAQMTDLSLPIDGLYRLEASRFDGSGSYTLTIEVMG